MIDSNASLGAIDGSLYWSPLSKTGMNGEPSSIHYGGYKMPIVDSNLTWAKEVAATIKKQLSERPLEERMADRFGNTVEGQIKQKVAMSKMTPEEQAVLLKDENYNQRNRVHMTRQDFEHGAKVFDKFNKLVKATCHQ